VRAETFILHQKKAAKTLIKTKLTGSFPGPGEVLDKPQMSDAFMARFKNKISAVNKDGGVGENANSRAPAHGSPKLRDAKQRQPRKRVPEQHHADEQDVERNERNNYDYQQPQQSADPHMNDSRGGRKPSLNDLDDMMLHKSMQLSQMPLDHPTAQSRQPPLSPQYSAASNSPVSFEQPARRRPSPIRQREQKKKAPERTAKPTPQYQDDAVNEYYRNRPKQKPSRSRATYLDEKLEAEQKEKSAPAKTRNESKIQSYSDHLAFSKKARPVNYRPKNLRQWKENQPEGYVELGKLKPDLNADHLVEKRANKERVKEFSKNLHNINAKICKDAGKKTRLPSDEQKELSSREKAQQYAKRVPRPRRRVVEEPEQQFDDRNLGDGEYGEEVELSALEELEMKHNAARREVDAIRKEMKGRGL
jgi:hypothetical protein